jgi:transporter family-2 protein
MKQTTCTRQLQGIGRTVEPRAAAAAWPQPATRCDDRRRLSFRLHSAAVSELTDMGALLSVALGVGSMVQLGQNGALARQLGHFLPASVVSYTGGVAILVAWQLCWRQRLGPNPKEEFRQGRARRPLRSLRWWEATGGAIGCCTLVSSVAASPHLSYTVMATSGSVGQLLSSLLADHTGFMGVPVRRLSTRRLLGAGLVLAGCAGASLDMAASASSSAATTASTLGPLAKAALALIYVVSRAGQPIQSCLNYRLAEYLPAPAVRRTQPNAFLQYHALMRDNQTRSIICGLQDRQLQARDTHIKATSIQA